MLTWMMKGDITSCPVHKSGILCFSPFPMTSSIFLPLTPCSCSQAWSLTTQTGLRT